MVDIKTIKAGDRIRQNYGNHRMGTVIGVFYPDGDGIGGVGINYWLDGEDHDDSWDWPDSLILVKSKPEQPKEQPMKISMDKQYRTRDGREVRILCVDREAKLPIVGLIDNKYVKTFSETGAYFESGLESASDLIEYNPAQDLKLDQPIWVKDCNDTEWYPRHFKGVSSNGNVECWVEGRTSHTSSKEYNMFTQWTEWSTTKPE